MTKLVVHVADIEVSEESGMGRIAWHWKQELERRGYDYIHIGPTQVGSIPHRGLFPYAAYRAYRRLKREADFFLVHEASSGPFLNRHVPAVVFSHGLDRRSWNQAINAGAVISLKSRILFPLWRIRQCDLGVKKAKFLLFSNYQDIGFVKEYYHKNTDNIFVFKNGVHSSDLDEKVQPTERLTVTFLASWLGRKGIDTLVRAASILQDKGLHLNWLLAGTGATREVVLSRWPEQLHAAVEVVPKFPRSAEESLLARSNIFVLPSYFEGQPLSLLQAMAAGRCCITTDCCGQRDIIQHGYNGLLYKPGDAQQFAALIEECANNEDQRMSLGRNAKLSVKDRRWETVSAELVDHIEAVLG